MVLYSENVVSSAHCLFFKCSLLEHANQHLIIYRETPAGNQAQSKSDEATCET